MPDIIFCEFQKLKRKKFIRFTIAAAFLFPIPLTVFMAKDGESFGMLFRSVILFGDLLFLPCVLGIIASMLFFMERDNDTLKNLMVIPVSKSKVLAAKLCVLMVLSVLYSVGGLGATIIGGLFTGSVEGIFSRLLVSVGLGIFVLLATLPVIALIIAGNKSYIFSILVSFAYAVIGFGVSWAFGPENETLVMLSDLLPVPVIFRWYLGVLPVEDALSFMMPYTISTPVTIFILAVIGGIFTFIAAFFYKRSEV